MSFDVDAIMRQTLSLVARERMMKEAPERQWEWLTACWGDVVELSRKLGVSFDDVDALLAQVSSNDSGGAIRRLGDRLSNVALAAARLHEARDGEAPRQQAAYMMRVVIKALREDLLSAGSRIGWHPRHIGAVWGGEQWGSGYRQSFIPLALRLEGGLTPKKVMDCSRDVLRTPHHMASVTEDRLIDQLIEMQSYIAPWRKALPEIRIPGEVVSRGWRYLADGSRSEVARTINAMCRDIRYLVEATQTWQVEREMSLVGMLFAVNRLERDIDELRGIVLASQMG